MVRQKMRIREESIDARWWILQSLCISVRHIYVRRRKGARFPVTVSEIERSAPDISGILLECGRVW